MKQKIKSFEDSIKQKKNDQIMVQRGILTLILFFKSKFDSLLSNKIKEGFRNVYKTLYMQNVMWSLLQNCVHNMNNWTKVISCLYCDKSMDTNNLLG
jgi:hypothetical protein